MQDIFTEAVVSHVKVENQSGVYERKLTASIDGANEIIWLTDEHINTVVDPKINETMSIAISVKQLGELNRIVKRIEEEK